MPTRELPYAEVQVYEPGHGDPILIDPGMAWYDVLATSYSAGTPGINSAGVPYVELVEGIGVCCRPFLVPQDTRSSHFTFSGGSWEEERLSTGGARNYRITQYDATNTVTAWSATSTYSHPANAQFAFSLILPDTPSDWDFTTYPPFIRVELGGSYAVQFAKDGSYLMRYVAGAWRAVMDLPSPPKAQGWADSNETWVYVRVLRGQICVSTDFGRTYARYSPPNEIAFIPAGRIVLRGRGGSVTFGVHQLKTFAGTWDSQTKPLERSRLGATVTFTGSRYDANGGTVGFTDLGAPISRLAQYRVTLTPPTATPGTAFSWYFTPVLYAVQYRIAPTVQITGNDYTNPWDDQLQSVHIVKPVDLAGGTATVVFHSPAYVAPGGTDPFAGYRWRKVEVILGYTMSEGDPETYTAFVGHIEEISVNWSEELSLLEVTVKLANASARLRRDPWTPFRQLALCQRTPNDAADEILYWFGLNSGYRDWHSYGAAGLIPGGSPEDPCELCNPQELPWETLTRIMQERFLEVGVDDTGVFFTLPKDYVSAGDAIPIRATAPDEGAGEDERNTSKSLAYRIDYKESCTAVIVYSRDEAGNFVFAAAYDSTAETNTTSPRFSHWRETVLKELSGTASAGYLLGHCQALAQEKFPLDRRADFAVPVDLRRSRREKLALYGYEGMGISDGSEFVLLTLEHQLRVNAGITELTTTGGLRRLDN